MALSRKIKAGDRITIGDVTIDCMEARGSVFRLGITAPDDVAIHVAPFTEESALHPPDNRAPAGV